MDTVLSALGVFVAILAIYFSFKYDWKKKPEDEKTSLLVLFTATKSEYQETIKEMKELCARHNLWNEDLYPGITYISYISELENSLNINFSDKVCEDMKSLINNKPAIEMFTRNIEGKHQDITAMRAQIKLVAKNIK